MPSKTVVILFSGGTDSCYVLLDALLNTQAPVHAHYVNIGGSERSENERKAIDAMLPIYQSIRGFTFTESYRDYGGMVANSNIVAMQDAAFLCSHLERNGVAVSHWMMGGHKGEGHNFARWNKRLPAQEVTQMLIDVFNATMQPTPPTPFRLHKMVTKSKQKSMLKQYGLLEHVWVCNRPEDGRQCGKCGKCEEYKEAKYVS